MGIWTSLRIHLEGRPDRIPITLDTHGGAERDMAAPVTDQVGRLFQHAPADGRDVVHATRFPDHRNMPPA